MALRSIIKSLIFKSDVEPILRPHALADSRLNYKVGLAFALRGKTYKAAGGLKSKFSFSISCADKAKNHKKTLHFIRGPFQPLGTTPEPPGL